MDNIYIKKTTSALSTAERDQWMALFQECFKKDRAYAEAKFRKYEFHTDDSWFCMASKNGRVVACYAGVILPFGAHRIFLATETMSNGTLRNATVKLAGKLYDELREAGIDAVCGFPNKNIIKIRERKLGWKITGRLNLFLGVPLLWRLGRRQDPNTAKLWHLRRPLAGFFSPPSPFLSLLGRNGLYAGTALSAVVTLSAKSPGPFFIRIPEIVVAPKMFGYVLTNVGNTGLGTELDAATGHLDLNTIDVP